MTPCADGETCTERGCVSPAVDETRLREASGTDDDLNIRPGRPVDTNDAGMNADATQVANDGAQVGMDASVTDPADGGSGGPGTHVWYS